MSVLVLLEIQVKPEEISNMKAYMAEIIPGTRDLTPVIDPVLNLGSKPFENQYQTPWPLELVAYS